MSVKAPLKKQDHRVVMLAARSSTDGFRWWPYAFGAMPTRVGAVASTRWLPANETHSEP